MAEPAAGYLLPAGVLRRHPGQGPRRRLRAQQGDLYCAWRLQPDGTKEILGIWIEQTEGAKFWLRVVNELKTRGVQDILIAVVDGWSCGVRLATKRSRELLTINLPAFRHQRRRQAGYGRWSGLCLPSHGRCSRTSGHIRRAMFHFFEMSFGETGPRRDCCHGIAWCRVAIIKFRERRHDSSARRSLGRYRSRSISSS